MDITCPTNPDEHTEYRNKVWTDNLIFVNLSSLMSSQTHSLADTPMDDTFVTIWIWLLNYQRWVVLRCACKKPNELPEMKCLRRRLVHIENFRVNLPLAKNVGEYWTGGLRWSSTEFAYYGYHYIITTWWLKVLPTANFDHIFTYICYSKPFSCYPGSKGTPIKPAA